MTSNEGPESLKITRRKKPKFLRQDAHRVKGLKHKWQKPRGIQSKMRICFRGYRRLVKTGFGSSLQSRGLSPEGLQKIRIETLSQFDNLDPKTSGIIIAKGVSMKTANKLIEFALKKGFTILNIKNPENFSEKIKKNLSERKQKRAAKKEKKADKKKSTEKKKAPEKTDKKTETKVDESTKTDEQKKDQEKEKKDKILTKKGAGF